MELTCKQKACLPLWCWKSFIHAKHEAFRFKYDTKCLKEIEDHLMDEMTTSIYINSFIYYIIVFVCPNVLVGECGGGIKTSSHMIYAGYSLVTFIAEIVMVKRIEKKIQNKNILRFNKWHVVELFMGQIARFDTYLDVCFFSLLFQCKQWELVIPIGILILIYISFPVYTLFKLAKI